MPQLGTGCGYGGHKVCFQEGIMMQAESGGAKGTAAENAKGATAEMRLSCIGTQGFLSVGDHEEGSVPLCLSH